MVMYGVLYMECLGVLWGHPMFLRTFVGPSQSHRLAGVPMCGEHSASVETHLPRLSDLVLCIHASA